jgi:hypothetical protein
LYRRTGPKTVIGHPGEGLPFMFDSIGETTTSEAKTPPAARFTERSSIRCRWRSAGYFADEGRDSNMPPRNMATLFSGGRT